MKLEEEVAVVEVVGVEGMTEGVEVVKGSYQRQISSQKILQRNQL